MCKLYNLDNINCPTFKLPLKVVTIKLPKPFINWSIDSNTEVNILQT